MRRRVLVLAAVLSLLLLHAAVPAAAQSFSDRTPFDAAAAAHSDFLDFEALTDGEVYTSLPHPGLAVRSTDGTPSDLLVMSPETMALPGLNSRVVLQNRNFGPLVLEFDPPVNAVGLDVLALDPSGSVPSTGVVVTVEGSAGTQSIPVALRDGGPAFFGILTGAETISRVTVANADGQKRYAGIDNVRYGAVPTGDPLVQALERLAAAVAEGREDGTIRRGGRALAAKVRVAQTAVARGKKKAAAKALKAFKHQVRATRREKITPARAEQLLGLADECLALLRP